MKLFPKRTEEDVRYQCNAVVRMLSYLRPHMAAMAACLVLAAGRPRGAPPSVYSPFTEN